MYDDFATSTRGLKGESIPLTARLFAVVDVYDALRSDRPYRRAWEHQRVLAYLAEQAGKHFDPAVVQVFLTQPPEFFENTNSDYSKFVE